MFKSFTISLLSLLAFFESVAAVPQIGIVEQDNIPVSKQKETIVRTRARAVVKDVAAKAPTDRQLYPVTIRIKRGPLSRGLSVCYFNEAGFNMLTPDEDFFEDESTGICTAYLPEGTLDLVVQFENMYINHEVGYFVNRGTTFYFIDDVTVNESTPELKADANECTMLPLSFVMANGKAIEFATKHWNGTGMDPESGGNCPSGSSAYVCYNAKYHAYGNQAHCSGVPTYYSDFGLDSDTDNPMSYWIPSCNKASDRWGFAFKIDTYTEEREGGLIAVSLNPSSGPTAVKLDDYNKLDWNFAEPDFKGIEYDFGIAFSETRILLETLSLFATDKPIDMYTAVVNGAEGIENLSYMIQTKCALEIDDTEPDWPEYHGILAPMANVKASATYFHPASYLFTAIPWTDTTKYREYLPEYTWGSEYSNYSEAELYMEFGNSTPFLTSSLWRRENHNTGDVTGFQLTNHITDLSGAIRTDWDKLESEVYFNGSLVKDKDVDFEDFQYSWNSEEKGLGKMTYIFTDTPDFKIDGLQPVNITEITYDQKLASWEPPTITSLLFRDRNGKVTNKITSGGHAVIDLYAGGTKWNQYWYLNPYANRYFSEGTTTISYDVTPVIEYAPTGSQNWQTFDMIENESERSPAYGNHYFAELNKVTTKSDNGWYDIRVTLTSPEGNTQIQTLSPAFKFTDYSEMENIVIDVDDVDGVRYYDLQGVRIDSPASGSLVIRVDGKGASKILYR